MKIRANGIEIEYDVFGPKDGIPLILISGFGSQMTSWPDELYRMFTDAGIKLIRFDNRDVGLAQKWDGIIPKPDDVMKAVAEGRRPISPTRSTIWQRTLLACWTRSVSRRRISWVLQWAE